MPSFIGVLNPFSPDIPLRFFDFVGLHYSWKFGEHINAVELYNDVLDEGPLSLRTID